MPKSGGCDGHGPGIVERRGGLSALFELTNSKLSDGFARTLC
jgi:hypothetical protein